MSSMPSQCLVAAGLSKIVWIDDVFAPRTRDELVELIHDFALKLKEQGRTKIDVASFELVALTSQKADVEDALDDILESMPTAQVDEAARAIAALTGASLPEIKPQADDLSTEDFKALKEAFGAGLRTFSLGEWTSVGAQEFASASEDTLFLIDKEYKREDSGMDGTRILADLVGKTRAFCVMLTYTWSEGEQEERRVNLASTLKLPSHRFCVLSKKQNLNLAIDPRFARAIR